jgi:hypothetical protein
MKHHPARLVAGIAIALGSAIVLAATPALAQSAAASSLSLTVAPLVVEFHAGAGDAGTATVTVHNGGTDPERIIALRMDWKASADGTVRVEQPGTEGKASIADYLRMEPGDVVLAPGETRELALTLDLPATFSQATAVYHSGFLVRAVPVTGHVNFGPAATIVAYDTVGTPASHAKLTQLHVSSPAGGAALLSARIVNDGAAYARSTGRIVLRHDGQVVVDETDSIPVLFGGEARVFNKALSGLAPGAYDVSLTIDYGGPTLIEGTTEVQVR